MFPPLINYLLYFLYIWGNNWCNYKHAKNLLATRICANDDVVTAAYMKISCSIYIHAVLL